MSVHGNWQGQVEGNWHGPPVEAPPGSISGIATISVNATGYLTGGAVVDPLTGPASAKPLQVVGRRKKIRWVSVTGLLPGWISGVATITVTATGDLTYIKKKRKVTAEVLLELDLV